MIEIPESLFLAKQLNQALKNRIVIDVVPWQSLHKFAFVNGDPAAYNDLFKGKKFMHSAGFGSWVEMQFDDMMFAVSEGANLIYANDEKYLPKKHQMLFKLDNDSYLCTFVKMYGAIVGAKFGEYTNKYYLMAKEKPYIFSRKFDWEYFNNMIKDDDVQNLSMKAFLATEQRIPGLGNGVLQDILYNSKIHPKEKVKNIHEDKKKDLFNIMKLTLKEMVDLGGRDTEVDLLGNFGGYRTKMSKNTVNKPCTICQSSIVKENYMGGSIYFCPICQSLSK